MIIVMRRDAKKEDIEHMIKQVESLKLKPTVLQGTERTVIAAIGDERNAPVGHFRKRPGRRRSAARSRPYKLASLETKSEPTVVRAGSLTVGGGTIGVIAGPCSVESEEQIVSLGPRDQESRRHGPPRRRVQAAHQPVRFQGLKEEGLKLLATARDETGLAVVTEVVAPEDVDLVCKYADVLQIGARNMQNYRLLEAVGRTKTPVLLKRGPSATVEELLLAAEYILDGGNQQVMLCERGIRTFEAHTRFTLPLGDGPLPARQNPPAGRHRPQPRHRPHAARGRHGPRRDRRRRRRHHRRGPPEPRKSDERRLPVDDLQAIRRHDGRLPQSRRGDGYANLTPR